MYKHSRYTFPDGMRPAAVDERREFYRNEFPLRLVENWFRNWKHPIVFALVVGRHSHIFPKEHRATYRDTIIIDEYGRLREFLEWILFYCPESVYYDRNRYQSWQQARNRPDAKMLGHTYGQELAFDIDPENFACPIHGTIEQKMELRKGLSFCRFEFQSARLQTLKLYALLSKQFSDIRLVYSGRGFHIHVLDPTVFSWTRKKRLGFAKTLVREGFVMDEWVASGGMRMIRLPFSLNALVSRICRPLDFSELESFDPLKNSRVIPTFLS